MIERAWEMGPSTLTRRLPLMKSSIGFPRILTAGLWSSSSGSFDSASTDGSSAFGDPYSLLSRTAQGTVS
jgi:hypothetical protein